MKLALACAIASALSLVACTSSQQGSQGTPAPEAATPGAAGAMATAAHTMMAKMAMHSRTVTMNAQNGSGESGKATLAGTGSKTTVTISLTGENATGKQPAHVHVGSCAKLGAVKYPLSDVVLGKSITVLNVPLDSFNSGNLAINVHQSAANLQKYVSCGDIAKANIPM